MAAPAWQAQSPKVVRDILLEAKYADLPVPVGFRAVPSGGPFRYAGGLGIEDVRDFYHKQMERLGWVLEDFSQGDEGMLVCRKPQRSCTISLREGGGVTSIVLFTEQVSAPVVAQEDINEKPVPQERE